jgi:hypothetical protein
MHFENLKTSAIQKIYIYCISFLEEMKDYPSAKYYFSQVLRYKLDHFADISN